METTLKTLTNHTYLICSSEDYLADGRCLKSAHIRSYSGPHFPAFGLKTERYRISLRIQSKCQKMRTRIAPNTDTFYAMDL